MMSRCKKGHKRPKKLPYGATKGVFWCHGCDADLVPDWNVKNLKKKERIKGKKQCAEKE